MKTFWTWLLILMLGLGGVSLTGCEDDAEIETPGGEVEVDVDE